MMLLAEDLILLLLDDEKGSFTAGESLDAGVGGAVLAELALQGAVEVHKKHGRCSSVKVRAVPGVRPEDPVLSEALAVVAEKERSASSLVEKLGKGTKNVLLERLEGRGVLQRQEEKVLGLFPRTRWPALDSAHEEQVRADLTAVLAGEEPEPRSGALVALLHATGTAHKVLTVPGLSKGDVRTRAKEVAEGEWAAKAVKDAVQAAQAAMAAVIASAGAATASGSG